MIQKIPQAELKVMKFIWGKNEEVTSKEVIESMENKYGWKQTTTLTLLSKLVKRKFLLSEKIDRYTHYKIIIKNREYLNFETKNFMSNMHNNSLGSLLTSLYQNKILDKENFEVIIEIVDNLE
ncbi:TPA: BlaI/MecI/CopY family transcriptional regulator [Clostridioides difficile]|uniref:BlaI/MecI/CopY family transcriptional regulator n=1 Tax=Clostridioides difficile TaxID=1496 RepID=UPI001C1B09A4|nr:BlaI/MecI/CopY family transcriptional regulator [Clostridioides difficile]MBY2832812.1 BlaI/MecI/CopY family transcriptional regulator [Clostridioides difficile]HBF4443199.1 BlaI/MecI/CopY family transcriptional regulator [Clostridioides difficile]HBG1420733.1 BlaI/MecI/CopY family transcriptional regulator [Clostridioides difficile]